MATPRKSAKPASRKTAGKTVSKPAAKPKVAAKGQKRAHDNKKGADGLTQQQRLFVSAYLVERNATKAATTAGYSEATAQQQGSRLLSNVVIKTAIDAAESEIIEKVRVETGITLERTLREIAKGAFFDPRKFFHPDGSPVDITELDDETAAALAGMEVIEQFEGVGENRKFIGYLKKYKVSDRKGYLDMLMKHLGGYKKDNEQGAEAAAKALANLSIAVKFVEPPAR